MKKILLIFVMMLGAMSSNAQDSSVLQTTTQEFPWLRGSWVVYLKDSYSVRDSIRLDVYYDTYQYSNSTVHDFSIFNAKEDSIAIGQIYNQFLDRNFIALDISNVYLGIDISDSSIFVMTDNGYKYKFDRMVEEVPVPEASEEEVQCTDTVATAAPTELQTDESEPPVLTQEEAESPQYFQEEDTSYKYFFDSYTYWQLMRYFLVGLTCVAGVAILAALVLGILYVFRKCRKIINEKTVPLKREHPKHVKQVIPVKAEDAQEDDASEPQEKTVVMEEPLEFEFVSVEKLSVDRKSSLPDDYISALNAVGDAIGALTHMGNMVDIESVEHFETFSSIASNRHIKFTLESIEEPGRTYRADNSSTRVEDYDFDELTHLKND